MLKRLSILFKDSQDVTEKLYTAGGNNGRYHKGLKVVCQSKKEKNGLPPYVDEGKN